MGFIKFSRQQLIFSASTWFDSEKYCHVSGQVLTPKYIPSFSWGSEGVRRYDFEKALQHIEGWKQLKGESITDSEITILKYIFDHF